MAAVTNIDRWSLIQEIFSDALELSPDERVKYVARACGDDEELHSEVASLLANDGAGTGGLRSVLAADLKGWAQTENRPETGLRVGPYRLIHELDCGGMGVVYLAARSDEHYFQIVAVKMLRPGYGSPELVQRFRTERQILATLTHPNIGSILDGGDTEDGRPFIAMEYVEGQPITQASKTGGWSIRRRIEVFCAVCSAVHYAHGKSIIHRDIKPNNVLVTPAGIVKLIDFGISKPLDAGLIPGEHTPTQAYQRLMTPDYASPEQMLGDELTTGTDIYSLGVLLFELLTDTRPYTLRELSPAAAEKLLLDQETRKPSSVRDLSAQTRRELAGDLDQIVLTAMDKEPARRYTSALELEEDLRRHLQGQPILAQKPTLGYRLGKFVKRHRTAAWMACAMIALTGGSIAFDFWQSRLADQRLEEVTTVADSAISDVTDKLQQSSVPIEVQAALFHSALDHLDQLRQRSGNDPRLLLRLSNAYKRVGDLEGSPYVANLGKLATAGTSFQEALHLALEAHKRMPGDESAVAIAELCVRLAHLESYMRDLERASDYYHQALAWTRHFSQDQAASPNGKKLVATSYIGLGHLQMDSLQPQEALKSFREAIRVFGAEPDGDPDHDRSVSKLYWFLGYGLGDLRPRAEELAALRKSVALAESVMEKSPTSVPAQRNLYLAYYLIVDPLAGAEMLNIGDARTAQLYASRSLAIAQQLADGDGQNRQAREDLGYAYTAMGDAFRQTDPAVAAGYYREAIAIARQATLDSSDNREAWFLVAERDERLAAVLAAKTHWLERLQLLEEANGFRRRLLSLDAGEPQDRLFLMRSYCKMADAELALNDVARARQYGDLSLPFFKEFTPSSPSLTVLREVTLCYESLGDLHSRMALAPALSASERDASRLEAQGWYQRSAEGWNEWNRRGAATPESDPERHKVEQSLHRTE